MLDSWTIHDADKVWDFRVDITPDENSGRPETETDVYDPAFHEREGDMVAARWAREVVAAWERDEWRWVTIKVTPVHKRVDLVFEGAAECLSGCDYGLIPNNGGTTDSSDRSYVRRAWADDLIKAARAEARAYLARLRKMPTGSEGKGEGA